MQCSLTQLFYVYKSGTVFTKFFRDKFDVMMQKYFFLSPKGEVSGPIVIVVSIFTLLKSPQNYIQEPKYYILSHIKSVTILVLLHNISE